jgi:tetratricopeptide (TPR) repeat protein
VWCSTARARFERPAIFGRRCPHEVDRLLGEARSALDASDPEGAFDRYEHVLRLDPHSFAARVGLACCDRAAGEVGRARERYGQLAADAELSPSEHAVVAERLGDLALAVGDRAVALEQYDVAERAAFDEHRRRTIEVKRYAAAGPGREALVELLVGDRRGRVDAWLASSSLGAWREREPGLGLADYLIAKNVYGGGLLEAAAEHLDRALDRELPLSGVQQEALRLRVLVACALGDRAVARIALDRYLHIEGLSLARKAGMQRFATRCSLLDTP